MVLTGRSVVSLVTLPLHSIVNVVRAKSFVSRFANRPALEETHRVLKPTGLLGMIWNIEDCKTHMEPFHARQELSLITVLQTMRLVTGI